MIPPAEPTRDEMQVKEAHAPGARIRKCPCGYPATMLTNGEHFWVQCNGPEIHAGKRYVNRWVAISSWDWFRLRLKAALSA